MNKIEAKIRKVYNKLIEETIDPNDVDNLTLCRHNFTNLCQMDCVVKNICKRLIKKHKDE